LSPARDLALVHTSLALRRIRVLSTPASVPSTAAASHAASGPREPSRSRASLASCGRFRDGPRHRRPGQSRRITLLRLRPRVATRRTRRPITPKAILATTAATSRCGVSPASIRARRPRLLSRRHPKVFFFSLVSHHSTTPFPPLHPFTTGGYVLRLWRNMSGPGYRSWLWEVVPAHRKDT
jgi:hypothetical protein